MNHLDRSFHDEELCKHEKKEHNYTNFVEWASCTKCETFRKLNISQQEEIAALKKENGRLRMVESQMLQLRKAIHHNIIRRIA